MDKIFKCKVISPINYYCNEYKIGEIVNLTQDEINAFGFDAVEKVLKSKEVVEIIPFDAMDNTQMKECKRSDLDDYALSLGISAEKIKKAITKDKLIKLIGECNGE